VEFKQSFKILGVAAAAGFVGALALGSPAFAEDTVIELKEAHQNQTADSDEFEVKCGTDAQIPADKPADYDGWVFVLPRGDAFVSVTATFEDEDGEEHVLDAAIVSNGNSGSAKHAYVGTPSGWTLITAEAVATGVDATDTFNVTHTCPGEPGENPSSPDEPSSPGSESPSEPGEESSSPVCEEPSSPGASASPSTPVGSETPCEEATSPAGSGNLPTTGTPLTIALVSAAALAAGGAALFMIQRRRREAQDW
jgi:hypothetical protein